jgi:hypothetical protein
MVGLFRRGVPWLLLALLVWGLAAAPGEACPFCAAEKGATLTEEVDLANMVLFGSTANADEPSQTTDLVVESVVKDHKERGKRNTVKLNRYVPPPLDGARYKYLVFFDIYKDKDTNKVRVDPYKGTAVKFNSKVPDYLKGAVAVKDKPIGQRLRFFFDHLDSKDDEVSNDAYREFAKADYKDYRDMARDLPAKKIIGWLDKKADTPAHRIGLYASMLGHCGKAKDAAVLRDLLEDPERRSGTGVDGVFAAYVLLQPKEGWKYTVDVLKDAKHDFSFRYAALRAVRFLHEYRSDVVSKKDLVEGTCVLLAQDDIADMAIEDLRKWECWDKADRVLALRKAPAYKMPIVRRAMLRYCLSCPKNAAARAYVAEQRRADPGAVEDAEDQLRYERESNNPPPPPAPPKK